MSTAIACKKCGQWFYSDYGQYISRPEPYDNALCPNCNQELKNQNQIKQFPIL